MSQLGGLGPIVIIVMWLESFITGFFVVLRIYTRATIVHSPGWDDHLSAITWVFLTVYAGCCTGAALFGMGQHSARLTVDQFARANKTEMIGQTFCIIGIAISKRAVAAFLLRIVVVQWQKWFLWFLMVITSILCFLVALFDFIQCKPIAKSWNPTIPGKCLISITNWSIGLGAWSVFVDLVLALMPWYIVWKLQMKVKEKIVIGVSMSLGVFAAACGIVRTIDLTGLSARSDYSFGLILWSSTEMTVTIVCTCCAALRPLYIKLFKGGQSSSNGYDQQNRYISHKASGYRLDDISRNGYTEQPQADTIIRHGDQDDKSDKSILSGHHGDGIKRTHEVVVTYDSADHV